MDLPPRKRLKDARENRWRHGDNLVLLGVNSERLNHGYCMGARKDDASKMIFERDSRRNWETWFNCACVANTDGVYKNTTKQKEAYTRNCQHMKERQAIRLLPILTDMFNMIC